MINNIKKNITRVYLKKKLHMRKLKFWWRDDDAHCINEPFNDLLEFQKKNNLDVYLSVIPNKITNDYIYYNY